MHNLFIELLQVSLGTRDRLSWEPLPAEWNAVYDEAERQAVTGIMLAGLERLSDNQRPPQVVLLQWIGVCQQIETQNVLTTKTCHKVCEQLERDGYLACVLKGQSNYRYYPKEMKNRRSCGDIDVWTVPKERRCKKEDVRKTLGYLKGKYELTGLCWLHANMTHESGVPVEVHFYPSFMNSPIKNRRFLKYFSDINKCSCLKDIDGIQIPAMKIDYDVIYQMNHIYRHLIDEGVGLRQVLDYYMLLKAWNQDGEREKEFILPVVRQLGMERFASALMYVLQNVFGMPDDWLLCEPSEKHGQFLLNEIMIAGNFGHEDPRLASLKVKEGQLIYQIKHAWRRIKRNMRFFTSYPEEVIWEPIVRVEHFVWKLFGLWKF